MKHPSTPIYILDTNVLLHLFRNDEIGKNLENRFHFTQLAERPLLSSITVGEILGISYTNKWSLQKIETLMDYLTEFVIVNAGEPEVCRAYAEIYADLRNHGQFPGENDAWIAATAKAAGAILITCDKDFDNLTPKHIKQIFIESQNTQK